MSSKTKVIGAVAGLLIVGSIAAAVAYNATRPAATVDVATAATGDIAVTVTAAGSVESDARGDVFPPTAGVLAVVSVVDGQRVVAGEVLATLDPEPLDLAIVQAEAGLAQAEAGLRAVDDQAPGSAELQAARAATDAAWQAYRSAQAAAAAVSDQAPGDAERRAAAAATQAARAAFDQAVAAYDALKAAYDFAPSPSAEASLTAAGVARDQARAAYLGAQATERSLASVDLSSQQAATDAGVAQAHAAYLSAKAQQEKLEDADVSPQRAAARAALEQAREALALAESNRAKATMRAPVDGTVLFNPLGTPAADGTVPKATPGAAVAPQAAVFTVVRLDMVRFTAEVDEVDVALVETGMAAIVRLDALTDRSFETTVSEIRPAATFTPTGGTVFPVYLRVAASDVNVLLGMKGDAEIEVSRVSSVVTLPIEALFDDATGSYVYTITEDDRLVRTPVELGALTESVIEIRSGVRAGDRVALAGAEELADGMRVSVR